MKFYIETFGCKVNSYESNYINESLISNGFVLSSNIEEADIVIVNTCTVTNTADAKCRKYINRVKRENPNAILVVVGCSVQNNFKEYEKMDIPILLGNINKSHIAQYINDYLDNTINIHYHSNNRDLEFEDMELKSFNQVRAYIKIQDGCDNFCSYCIIPFTRGKCRSKDFESVIKEAKDLVHSGHKEIVLTGIHTGSYNNNGHDLVDVINALSEINGIERIRLSSVEITELNDKFMNMLKENKKFCDHLHIPLQAGSNEVLKMMNRKYDLDYFENKIKEIRMLRPNISITTDIIVGFPTETDEMFNSTCEFSKKIKFSKIHVFPFSKRAGTVASNMKEVKDMEKKERVIKLLKISDVLENEYSDIFKNKVVKVLIEEVKNSKSIGHTSNYLRVVVPEILEINKIYEIEYKG